MKLVAEAKPPIQWKITPIRGFGPKVAPIASFGVSKCVLSYLTAVALGNMLPIELGGC